MKLSLTTAVFVLLIGSAAPAMADDSLCIPLAKMARIAAEKRDAGVSKNAFITELARSGQLHPNSDSTAFVMNAIVWVYDEGIKSRNAYPQMLAKCRAAVRDLR